jgi:P22_AR N-terminal domain
MALQEPAQYTYPTLSLPRWDLTVPTARQGNTLYFPVAFFCDFLGIDKRKQVEVLRADPRNGGDLVLREVPFKLSGVGWRTPLAIRKAEAAVWLAGIDPARCKPAVRDRVRDFQADVIAAADRLLFGESPSVPVEQRGAVEYSQHERVKMNCLDCGAPHVVVIINGVAHVERERRD